MRAETIKGHLDLLLLAVVGDGGAHGYAVITELAARSDGALKLPEGTVYPALHRLEAAGLLSSDWTAGAAPAASAGFAASATSPTGRRRRVYRLTPAGRAALEQRRADWHDFAAAVAAVLTVPAPNPA